MKGLLFALIMAASSWLVDPASAHIVEVTTSVDAAEAEEPAAFKQAVHTALDKILKDTVAFQPTLVALTDAQVVGARVYIRILLADADGERMLKDVQGGTAGPSPDAQGRSRNPDELKI